MSMAQYATKRLPGPEQENDLEHEDMTSEQQDPQHQQRRSSLLRDYYARKRSGSNPEDVEYFVA